MLWEVKRKISHMTTTIDIESHPCYVSFSEQFIISLKSASAMWNVCTNANKKAMDIIDKGSYKELNRRSIIERKSANRCGRSSLHLCLMVWQIVQVLRLFLWLRIGLKHHWMIWKLSISNSHFLADDELEGIDYMDTIRRKKINYIDSFRTTDCLPSY